MKPNFECLNLDAFPFDNCKSEKRFLLSLITSAILDAIGEGSWVGNNNLSDRKRYRAYALSWLMSDAVYASETLGVSFLYACEHLDLCPNKIRREVLSRQSNRMLEAA